MHYPPILFWLNNAGQTKTATELRLGTLKIFLDLDGR